MDSWGLKRRRHSPILHWRRAVEVHAWPELMKAVKAGKINATSFGFTIPQELKSARAAAASASGGSSSTSLIAPPARSLFEFLLAIFGFILPCLADQPEALFEWIHLAQSIVVMDHEFGWATANQYLEKLLTERVNHIGSDDAVDNELGLRELSRDLVLPLLAQPRLTAASSGATPAARPGGHSDSAAQVCFRWNRGTCTFSSCNLLHVCHSCYTHAGGVERSDHTARDSWCPRYEQRSMPGLNQQQKRQPSGSSGGSQGGAGKRDQQHKGGFNGGKRGGGGGGSGKGAAAGNSNGGAGGSGKEQ